ncbi:hypothetical protein HBB16_13655 [Pseudonocardia sp. MCCB 268]|nr:hypothetical protein [Pseudonocardia cytotoxica]
MEVEQAHLLGQSMSRWAVVGAAQRAPERVKSRFRPRRHGRGHVHPVPSPRWILGSSPTSR